MAATGRINDDLSQGGVLVFNYGDPSYRGIADSTPHLSPSAAIFIRLLAYLIFVDALCIPVRHILDSTPMAEAIGWATPLLEAGLVLPARRADAHSFEDYAKRRGLEPSLVRRANQLDLRTRRPYLYEHEGMSSANRDLLTADLTMSGAFRRIVSGGQRGKYAEPLSSAHAFYKEFGDGAPDSFVTAVTRYAPDLGRRAKRWAMARYYTTPAIAGIDTVNTREIPKSASDLLTRAGALYDSSQTFEAAAPVELATHRLWAVVPDESIETNNHLYCDALLEVRRAIPYAREIFADVFHAEQLEGVSEATSHRLERELNKQLRSAPGKGRAFSLVSSLVGGAAGLGVGLVTSGDPTISAAAGLGFGVASGVASNEIQKSFEGRSERRRRPWLLAMDRLETSVLDKWDPS